MPIAHPTLAEQGTHDELMQIPVVLDPQDETKAISGHYAHLWKSSQTPEADSLAEAKVLVQKQKEEIRHLKQRLRFVEIQQNRAVGGKGSEGGVPLMGGGAVCLCVSMCVCVGGGGSAAAGDGSEEHECHR